MVNEQLINELNDVKAQLAQLQAKKVNSAQNLLTRVNANKCYAKIANYCNEKNIILKSCGAEYNKIFVKHDNTNIMFLLVKVNDVVTFYTKHAINDNSITGNTYPKQYEYRTIVKFDELNDDMLNNIFAKSIEAKAIRATVSKTTIAELNEKIAQLTAQLNEKQVNEAKAKKAKK